MTHTKNRQPEKSDTPLRTLHEAAERLRVSHWTLNRLMAERQLASVKIGRRRFINRTDLDDLIERLTSGGDR